MRVLIYEGTSIQSISTAISLPPSLLSLWTETCGTIMQKLKWGWRAHDLIAWINLHISAGTLFLIVFVFQVKRGIIWNDLQSSKQIFTRLYVNSFQPLTHLSALYKIFLFYPCTLKQTEKVASWVADDGRTELYTGKNPFNRLMTVNRLSWCCSVKQVRIQDVRGEAWNQRNIM